MDDINLGYYRFLESIGMNELIPDSNCHITAFIYRDRATATTIYRRIMRMHQHLYRQCLFKLIDGNCIYQSVPYCRITRSSHAICTSELENVAVNKGIRPFKDWWAVGSSCSLPRRFDWYSSGIEDRHQWWN